MISGGCCHDYAKQKDILKPGLEQRANVVVTQIHTDDGSTKPPLAILGNLATEGPLLLTVGLGFGMALLAGIWAVGHVSGAHFNPAVTLAMLLDGRTTFGDAIGYWVSQFAGAGVASLVVWAARLHPWLQRPPTGASTDPAEIALTAYLWVILRTAAGQPPPGDCPHPVVHVAFPRRFANFTRSGLRWSPTFSGLEQPACTSFPGGIADRSGSTDCSWSPMA
jgi:hypothetical protein